MPWEKRGNGRQYFYKKLKVGGKVCSVYLGSGQAGEEAARQQAERAAQRRQAREQLRSLRESVASIDQAIDQLAAEVELLLRAAFVASGWFYHCHGEWRQRHGRDGDRINSTALAVRASKAGA